MAFLVLATWVQHWVNFGQKPDIKLFFSYSRDGNKLRELATSAGTTAKAGTIQEAAAQDVILLAVWLPALEDVIHAAGALDGKIVIGVARLSMRNSYATVTICGAIAPETKFDPDAIADVYWQLHTQMPDNWRAEYVYQ